LRLHRGECVEAHHSAVEGLKEAGMALHCFVVRGLVKEVEEDLNKFLASHSANILHMAQSEHGEYITVTLIYQELAPKA